jgi:hypothetical protein
MIQSATIQGESRLRQRRDFVAAAGTLGQVGCGQDIDVRPDGLPEHLVTAEDANLVADPFFYGFGDFVDRKAKCVRHWWFRSTLKHHSHCAFSPLLIRGALTRLATSMQMYVCAHNKKLTQLRHFHAPVESRFVAVGFLQQGSERGTA